MPCRALPRLASRQPSLRRPSLCGFHTRTPHADPHTAPTALRGRRAQRKFMDLGGSAEKQGDLKSVVLHELTMGAHKSTFPIALGVRLTGVDDACYSQTGESYSMIAMPNADTHMPRTLQKDNTELVRTGCHCPCTTQFRPPARARSESHLALLHRRTSVICKRLKPQRERLKPHHTHTRLTVCSLPLVLQSRASFRGTPLRTLTPRASTRCVRACSTPSATRSHAHTHTSTDTHALRRRSPRAASALSPRIIRSLGEPSSLEPASDTSYSPCSLCPSSLTVPSRRMPRSESSPSDSSSDSSPDISFKNARSPPPVLAQAPDG